MEPTERLLTVKEVAQYLGLSTGSVNRWANDGIIPAMRIGRRWVFRKAEIDAWLEASRVVPLPSAPD